MKKILGFILSAAFLFASCNNGRKSPDVSDIKIETTLKRFDQDFFSIDTNQITFSLQNLYKKYPLFARDYFNNILGLNADSILIEGNRQQGGVKLFLKDYMPVKDSAAKLFGDFKAPYESIHHSLQLVKYYFPDYKLPNEIITFIGPIDAAFQTTFGTQGDILTEYALGVGLQLHMGKDFSFYTSPQGRYLYPDYIAANFDPEHITTNCMRNIVDDLFPFKLNGNPLLEQMVELGKRVYLVQVLTPDVSQNVALNYSKAQFQDCIDHEAMIWEFFLKNELLNSQETNMVKNYIGEGPKTPELGEGAPGNIGSFAGLRIVEKYMDKYPKTTLAELMKMPPREVYTLSKYKPRG